GKLPRGKIGCKTGAIGDYPAGPIERIAPDIVGCRVGPGAVLSICGPRQHAGANHQNQGRNCNIPLYFRRRHRSLPLKDAASKMIAGRCSLNALPQALSIYKFKLRGHGTLPGESEVSRWHTLLRAMGLFERTRYCGANFCEP